MQCFLNEGASGIQYVCTGCRGSSGGASVGGVDPFAMGSFFFDQRGGLVVPLQDAALGDPGSNPGSR